LRRMSPSLGFPTSFTRTAGSVAWTLTWMGESRSRTMRSSSASSLEDRVLKWPYRKDRRMSSSLRYRDFRKPLGICRTKQNTQFCRHTLTSSWARSSPMPSPPFSTSIVNAAPLGRWKASRVSSRWLMRNW